MPHASGGKSLPRLLPRAPIVGALVRVTLCLVTVLAVLACAAVARAEISPVAPLDGPSADIVDFGGSAMASDGTGGIVYRKRVSGRIHIFAAQYVGGKWNAPQRVDVGETFDSSFPAIAAGEGGRLVVVWANHYSSTTDGLFSATIDPGSGGFQPPVPVDLNIGQATGTYPSVAMNLSGQALVAYRVITAVSGPSTPNIPPGYVLADIRMARFDGQYWSSFGVPLERNPAQPVPQPTAVNSPQVAIDLTGQGLARLAGARRLVRQPHLRSAHLRDGPRQHPAGQPLHVCRAPAERARRRALFGPRRLRPGRRRLAPAARPGSGFTRPRVFEAEIPSSFDPHGSVFGAAKPVDGPASADGPTEALGPLSMAVDGKGGFDVGFGTGHSSFDTGCSQSGITAPVRLDAGSEVPGDPVLTRADDGALAAAWKLQSHGSGAVAVLERRADGTPNRSLVAAPRGGAVHQLSVGGSHRGDAIFGFLQGDGPLAQIAAVVVRAPPGEFVTSAPSSWVRSAKLPLQWEVPLAGAGRLTYGVLVDDREVAENLTGNEYTLTRSQVAGGVHTIQVEATDSLGQVVDSVPATLRVDRGCPRCTCACAGNGHRAGARRGQAAGLRGEGRLGQGPLRRREVRTWASLVHALAMRVPGSYTIVVASSTMPATR